MLKTISIITACLASFKSSINFQVCISFSTLVISFNNSIRASSSVIPNPSPAIFLPTPIVGCPFVVSPARNSLPVSSSYTFNRIPSCNISNSTNFVLLGDIISFRKILLHFSLRSWQLLLPPKYTDTIPVVHSIVQIHLLLLLPYRE